MVFKENKIFVQIGTNDGNDEFLKLVKRYNPSMVILVEPVVYLIDKIKENYKNITNVFIENVAITSEEIGDVELVIPMDEKNGKSINGIHYEDKGYTLIPMDDWGNNFNKIKTKSMTFSSLCNKYNISDIHFLQIDTEGYDSEIIKSINFSEINIDVIQYEIWQFEESAFKRHGENSTLYGSNGMQFVEKILTKNGYKLLKLQNDMVAIKNK